MTFSAQSHHASPRKGIRQAGNHARRAIFVTWAAGLLLLPFGAGEAAGQTQPVAKDLASTMVANEGAAAQHKVLFAYTSVEKSDRTAGHLWTERVVETPTCRVRLLTAVDGQPLTPELAAAERNRLTNDAAHPEDYAARDRAQTGGDDAHAQSLLELIVKGFLLEHVQAVNGDWRMDFRPDPSYSPSGSEEKVLHGMVGWLTIDQKTMRLRHIEGKLPEDVTLYGFLATVHAGSHFESTKIPIDQTWRTTRVVTDIRGKAALFKTIGKNVDSTRSAFAPIAQNLTVAQAVAIAEK